MRKLYERKKTLYSRDVLKTKQHKNIHMYGTRTVAYTAPIYRLENNQFLSGIQNNTLKANKIDRR